MRITLANLSDATPQQVFDQVAVHLLTQNSRSTKEHDAGFGCAYRGDNGLACAAGCLIDDSEYRDLMEDRSWFDLAREGWVPETHKDLIQALQQIHDDHFTGSWRDALASYAFEYGLSSDILDTVRVPA